ncbi:MAG TPA: 4-alpha-glucanotransferase [Mycobacteriales bacterium]|nr:4-alpha-glucanotransferase [Mycobacteriales bacterium]
MTDVDEDLARLAAHHGVATSYADQLRRPVQVDRAAVVGVLAALGVDASTQASVHGELAAADGRSPTPSVVVVKRSVGGHVAVGGAAQLRLEDGSHRTVASDGGRVRLAPGLPLGYHCLELGDRELPVVVTPDRVSARDRRGWGWAVQLYALRSAGSWGIGDASDLHALTEWTAAHGGDLVLVNPLHAVAPTVPMQPSPYYPGSRRWTNPLYLRVEQTPWYDAADAELRRDVDALKPSYNPDRIDRDAAWSAKFAALDLLWRRSPSARAGDSVLPSADDDLWTFATWCALCEVHGGDWRRWPQPLRRCDSPAVAQARRDLDERVQFFAWLQVLIDQQLAETQRVAREAGMDVGVVHDLAVGADPAGADVWMLQDVLALSARIGAPPDTFNQQGQDWQMPPWHPDRLAATGYAPLRDMLRSLLRHAGGVRIDHVLGMFRLWWIPDGAGPGGGTYVSYDADALLGIIALEAERAGAVVVGEDLGVVPAPVRTTLRDRGLLGSSVLWFERVEMQPGELGPLRPMDQWREEALASVTTHDLPTALGWLRGEHLRVRAELAIVDDPVADEASWREQRAELLALLVDSGVLPSADLPDEELALALHRFIARTPSRYVVAAPGDAVGDLRQPNVPGTVDEYPNWRLPIADSGGRALLLAELLADPRVERLAAELRAAVR